MTDPSTTSGRLPDREFVRPPGWLPREEYLASLPKTTAYASLFFTDEAGRPLQLRPTYTRTETWQNPGGNMDPGETPWATAVRETFEETGIRFAGGPTQLLVSHFRTPGPGSAFGHIGFIFDGGVLTDAQLAALVLDPAEHDAWQVNDLPTWRTLMNPQTHTRLTACRTARATGTTTYLATEG